MRLFSAFCLLLSSTLACASTNPTYARSQDIATPFQHLNAVAIADFNGDGKNDLAVTSGLDKNVLIYLNNGNGSFSSPISVPLAIDDTLGDLVVGDFNEDGKQDLIVATISGDQQDILLLGNGDGTFTRAASLPGSFGFFSASVADINNDGHLDLVSGGNGDLYVYLGDGHGNFSPQPLPQYSHGAFFGLTVADFNKDHNPDLVTGVYDFGNAGNTQGISLFAGIGSGSFASPTQSTASYILNPYQFASADFNGDGNLDLLFSQPNEALVLFGNGDGTFQLPQSQTAGFYVAGPYGTAIAPPLVAAADMNADGRPDGIVADLSANSVNIFFNDGTDNFYNQANFSAALDPGTGAMQLADLNGDGLPDIVLTNYQTQKISIFLSIAPKSTPTLTLILPAAQVLVGTPLTVTAKIAGTTTMPVATGSVTLMDGTTSLGQQTLNNSGEATFSLSGFTSTGAEALSFTYTGDQHYVGGTSPIVTATVTDFQVLASVSSETVASGGTATYNLQVNPINGLVATASASCSGLPSTYSCPPASVSLSGTPATLSLRVTAPVMQGRVVSAPPQLLLAFLGLPFLPAILCRRRLFSMLACTLTLIILVGLSGCSSTHAAAPAPATSTFEIVVSVTENGQMVTHSLPVTLTVN